MSQIEMIEPESTSTELAPVEQRAALALQSTKTEQGLRALSEQLQTVSVVNSPAGRDQAHALAMTATRMRTSIEKAGKAARDDATKFSKAVIAEQARLIGLIEPEETRVKGLRDAWDKAEAERKEAEAQRERDRIAAHQVVIEQIKGYPALAAQARTSAMALQMLERLTAIDTSVLEEFAEMAAAAKLDADEKVNTIIDQKKADEAEAARLKAEQEAEAARLAAERAELERQQAEAKRQADELAAAQKAEADRLPAERAEIERQRAELEAAQKAAAQRELAEAQTNPEGQELSPAAQAILEKHGAANFAKHHPKLDTAITGVDAAIGPNVHTEHLVVLKGEALPPASSIDKQPDEAPSAQKLIAEVAFAFGVDIDTAHRWLADRADEFKHAHQTILEVVQ